MEKMLFVFTAQAAQRILSAEVVHAFLYVRNSSGQRDRVLSSSFVDLQSKRSLALVTSRAYSSVAVRAHA
jgi:hypothetical protein